MPLEGWEGEKKELVNICPEIEHKLLFPCSTIKVNDDYLEAN